MTAVPFSEVAVNRRATVPSQVARNQHPPVDSTSRWGRTKRPDFYQ